MKNIKIEVPEGYEVDKSKSTFENIVFKPVDKKITERIKTFGDVCTALGVSQSCFKPSEHEDNQDAALRKVKAIARVLNEGWCPDFEDSSETKYAPWFRKVNGSTVFCSVDYWCSRSSVPAPSLFKSRELAGYAGTQFIDIYTEAFTL